jgi:UDP-N-acetylglucosamine 2-epimerase (non-hydrolysing)
MHRKVVIFGTRPEFIKLLPLIWEIRKQKLSGEYYFLYTGQQHDLVKNLFLCFGFSPDETIPFVNHGNSLPDSFMYLSGEIQKSLRRLLKAHRVSTVIGLGDTTSCACAAISAYLNKIPFAHLEAGLRTDNLEHPWPEEYFRKISSLSSNLHMVPTASARNNLLKEGIDAGKIHVTGNTIVDVIHYFRNSVPGEPMTVLGRNKILVSCHRRENQRKNIDILASKIAQLAGIHKNYEFIWLTHPNMSARVDTFSRLTVPESNLVFSHPLDLADLYRVYSSVRLIISDSGGMQEEAPSFNIPVIVIRKHTERMESVRLGYSEIVADLEKDLVPVFNKRLRGPIQQMKNPYGDGKAGERIIGLLQKSSNL